LLKIENLSIQIAEQQLLHELSIEILPGNILGIVGESGSGKSITGLSIIGLLNANLTCSGKIFLNGTELLSLSEKEKHSYRGTQIGMIFQEPMSALHPALTCGEQIAEALRYHLKLNHSQAKAKVFEVFEEVKLNDAERIYSSYPHQISGGQRQRVMIAMAICLNPSIIIADEPTTALDVTVQQNIVELIRDITIQRNIACIFISHDLPLVASISNHIAVLYQGRMVEYNSPSALLNNPVHAYTKALFACKPDIKQQHERLLTVSDIFQGKSYDVNEKAKIRSLYSEPLFEIQALRKVYTKRQSWFSKPVHNEVLKNISFQIFKGESLGLVGESGSGKTTIAKLILRLEDFDSGSILFQNQAIQCIPKIDYHHDVQIVFQDSFAALNPKIRIGEAILEPLRIHFPKLSLSESKQRVKEMLEKVGLQASDYSKLPKAFSGGQRQRINIARSLIIQPKFLVLDESVAALDVSVQAQVLNLLNDLKTEFGLTYLFITHDLSVVHHFCDRVIVLDKGEIVEMGNAQSVIEHPQHPYTQKLVSAIPGFKSVAS
jgi:peptide/nickel transport system ATP-binding protein